MPRSDSQLREDLENAQKRCEELRKLIQSREAKERERERQKREKLRAHTLIILGLAFSRFLEIEESARANFLKIVSENKHGILLNQPKAPEFGPKTTEKTREAAMKKHSNAIERWQRDIETLKSAILQIAENAQAAHTSPKSENG